MQNLDLSHAHVVDQNERCAGDHQLARAFDAAGLPHTREALEPVSAVHDRFAESSRGSRIVRTIVVIVFDQLGGCRLRPAHDHQSDSYLASIASSWASISSMLI